jgi:hypothetical protein
MEWLCDTCNHANTATRIYSFLNKCKNCKRSPRSFVCPHCGKLNFLDKARDGSHPASSVLVPIPAQTRDEIRRQKLEERADAKEELEHDIVLERLNGELAALKAARDSHKPVRPLDKLEADFAERKAHGIGVYQIAAREYELNKTLYKNNPDLLEQADSLVKEWVEDHTLGA